jgi:hypothetical protein
MPQPSGKHPRYDGERTTLAIVALILNRSFVTRSQFNDAGTSTQGFLARDDTNKLLVVALRGSQQIEGASIPYTTFPIRSRYLKFPHNRFYHRRQYRTCPIRLSRGLAFVVINVIRKPHAIYGRLVSPPAGATVHAGFLTAYARQAPLQGFSFG